MSNGVWRPELAVCPGCTDRPALLIGDNTLWYGTYRVNATVAVSLKSAQCADTLFRSVPANTYLAVRPSELVASLVTDETDYKRSDMINLNMTGSRDPDVTAANRSGIRLEVFCFPESAAETFKSLNADQMRTTATAVASNRYVHARCESDE